MAKPDPELIDLMLRAHGQFVVTVTGEMARFAGLPPRRMREAIVGCVEPVLERATAGRELSAPGSMMPCSPKPSASDRSKRSCANRAWMPS